MSINEMKADREATYEALLRLIDSGRIRSNAGRKLVDRLEYTVTELVRAGHLDPGANDVHLIRAGHGL